VRHEYRAKSSFNPVDYGLAVNEEIKLIIEAKYLGENLNKWVTQLLGNVAVAGGVQWCVLTDGDRYRVYSANGDGDADQKLFFEVRISDDSDDTIKFLSLLSKSNMAADPPKIDIEWEDRFVKGHVEAALQEMMDGTDRTIINRICRRFPEHKAGAVTAALARLEVRARADQASGIRGSDQAPVEDGEAANATEIFEPNKSKRPKAIDLFKRFLTKPMSRESFIERMIAAGFTASTMNSYVSWAQNPEADLGSACLIEQYKDEKGVVMLRKKGN
jgi:hypothetical protein